MKSALLRNRFTTLLFAAVLGLLTACGDGDDQTARQEEQPAAQSGTTTSQSEPAAEAAATDEPEPTAAAEPAGEQDGDTATTSGSATAGEDTAADETAAEPERHTVTARSTAFDPVVVKIKPGDSVSWVNMSGHNVNFEAGNVPEGFEPWKTALGEDVNRTFDIEGVYLYKCDPHFALGMVGAVIVGDPVNLEQVSQNAQGMYKRALAKAKAMIE